MTCDQTPPSHIATARCSLKSQPAGLRHTHQHPAGCQTGTARPLSLAIALSLQLGSSHPPIDAAGRRALAANGVDIRHQSHDPDDDSASRKINRKKIVRKAAEFALDEFKIDLK